MNCYSWARSSRRQQLTVVLWLVWLFWRRGRSSPDRQPRRRGRKAPSPPGLSHPEQNILNPQLSKRFLPKIFKRFLEAFQPWFLKFWIQSVPADTIVSNEMRMTESGSWTRRVAWSTPSPSRDRPTSCVSKPSGGFREIQKLVNVTFYQKIKISIYILSMYLYTTWDCTMLISINVSLRDLEKIDASF